MKKTVTLFLALVVLPVAVSAADGMRDGYWEMVTTMDMPGMPVQMAPQKMKHCFSKEDVKDQKKVIANDKDCTVTELKTVGNKVTWKMKCTGKSQGTFSGETVFSPDSYSSDMKMQSQGHVMNMNVKGKRLGNCP